VILSFEDPFVAPRIYPPAGTSSPVGHQRVKLYLDRRDYTV
jgi:hypothetical protein